MKDIGRLGAILFVIAAICSGMVAFANEITKGPIAEQKAQAKALAMQEVLPAADSFEEIESGKEGIDEVQIGLKDGQQVGYAIRVAPKGYDGAIEMMVGISNDGVVEGINILSHSETPGLGANATDPDFTDSFKGKNQQLRVSTSGTAADDEISAITGATVTTVSITEGVNRAIEYVENQGGGAN